MENSATITVVLGLVLLTPLLSFLVCMIIPDGYSWLVTIIAPFFLLISAVAGVYLFFTTPANTSFTIQIEWFQVSDFAFQANIQLNRLAVLMVPLITVISFLIHLYSVGYMAGDGKIKRYFAMLGFFTFSMLGIIVSDNLLVIFIFWELVGFSSYILIGHFAEKPAAAQAASKAFIFNRIGDVGFLVGLMIVWANTQTFNLSDLLNLTEVYSWQTAASLCIFCGVVGKSAQFPLFAWLPDAMEGPTPVSALIHAATMVAAGVFLLARVFPLFTTSALQVVIITGSFTALLAALCALNQVDLKKILAYSTISQLGLMVTAVGAGSENAAMLHLLTHAFFKAGLFLAAGSVIHSLHQAQQQAHDHFDVQDIRNLGGLRKKMPITFFTFILTGASLAGLPFFSGFTSKDSIASSIWFWAGTEVTWRWSILICVFVVSFTTVLYTFRMIWFIFFANNQRPNIIVSESPWIMRISLLALAITSCWFILSVIPFQGSRWFIGLMGDIPHSTPILFISGGVVLSALVTSWFIYSRKLSVTTFTPLQHAFHIDRGLQYLFHQPTIKISTGAEIVDRKWIDGLLHLIVYAKVSIAHVIAWSDKYIVDGIVNTLALIVSTTGSFTRSFQGGKIQLYIFWAMAGIIIFLFFVLI